MKKQLLEQFLKPGPPHIYRLWDRTRCILFIRGIYLHTGVVSSEVCWARSAISSLVMVSAAFRIHSHPTSRFHFHIELGPQVPKAIEKIAQVSFSDIFKMVRSGGSGEYSTKSDIPCRAVYCTTRVLVPPSSTFVNSGSTRTTSSKWSAHILAVIIPAMLHSRVDEILDQGIKCG